MPMQLIHYCVKVVWRFQTKLMQCPQKAKHVIYCRHHITYFTQNTQCVLCSWGLWLIWCIMYWLLLYDLCVAQCSWWGHLTSSKGCVRRLGHWLQLLCWWEGHTHTHTKQHKSTKTYAVLCSRMSFKVSALSPIHSFLQTCLVLTLCAAFWVRKPSITDHWTLKYNYDWSDEWMNLFLYPSPVEEQWPCSALLCSSVLGLHLVSYLFLYL